MSASHWHVNVLAQIGTLSLAVDISATSQVVALVGPNGSGKSSLLRVLLGAQPVQRAQVVCAGRVLEDTSQRIRLPVDERRIGYVPQGYSLFPHLTVLGNVAFGLSTGPAHCTRAEREEKARLLLEELGCAHLTHRHVQTLSGGEQQRVALARALLPNPDFLLLDEPLSALDTTTRRTVRAFLSERFSQFSRPILLVTHDVKDVRALATDVVVVENGQVVQRGTLAELSANPASDFVSEFVE